MENASFRRILLATDGSNQAEAAGRVATALAESSRAVVRVVHVWNLEVHHRHGIWDVEMRSEAEKLISGAVERLRALGVAADGCLARADENHVGAAIAEAAREFDADLVVVGSRGLSDWRSMFEHSVSHQVLGGVDCPVLLVREAGSSILHEPSRVLLALAGGNDVAPGVRAAIAAAATPGSRVLVTHVAQTFFGAHGSAYVESDEEIQNTLESAASMLKDVGIATETRLAPSGPVAHAIATIAWQWQADIIVTGSSRMTDLASIIFGSVTHDLLRATRTPVLVAERVNG
jgi:nucleotide-binding universal stress UspA family protein